MKKLIFMCAALFTAACLSACSRDTVTEQIQPKAEAGSETELSFWTFPVGNWGNPTAVSSLIAGFHKEHPEIHVTVECVDYNSGDKKIQEAVSQGKAPDLVFEGPERLVAGWGNEGLLADLSDLWESDAAGEIYENIRKACQHTNGAYYEYPVCMTAHCMAVNYDLFKKAGALKYIDEETHTWTTKDFIKAVNALKAYGHEQAGAVYCCGQSGDQGTRALVNNLYGGTFTDEAHSVYTADSEENIKALVLLKKLKGITFEPDMTAADEIASFCSGELAMTFCWNASIEITQTVSHPELDFEIFPMAFPSADGRPSLQGGIWGFGIFDNGDEKRAEAAKTFIRYMTQNDDKYKRAVLTSFYWPVRELKHIYENDDLMTEYSMFMQYMGDYYQVTPGWDEARKGWWKMLQKAGNGENIPEAVHEFAQQANADLKKEIESSDSR